MQKTKRYGKIFTYDFQLSLDNTSERESSNKNDSSNYDKLDLENSEDQHESLNNTSEKLDQKEDSNFLFLNCGHYLDYAEVTAELLKRQKCPRCKKKFVRKFFAIW